MKRILNRRTLRRLTAAVVLVPVAASAATDNWQTVSGSWDNVANWDLGHKPSPNDDAVFPAITTVGSTGLITLTNGETANSLVINGGSYSFSGGDLALTSGILNADIAASGILNTRLIDPTSPAGLTKNGFGTITLNNSTNAFTGLTTINLGAIQVSNDTSITGSIDINGTTTRGTGGGQLNVGGTYSGGVFSHTIDISGGGPSGDGFALISNNTNFTGTITSTTQNATRILSAFGTTNLSSLVVGSTQAVGAAQTLQLAGNYNWALTPGGFSGTGILQKGGGGTLILTGTNTTFTGTLQSNGGFIRLNNVTNVTNAAISESGGTFEFRTDALTFNKTITLAASTTLFTDHAIGTYGTTAAVAKQEVFGQFTTSASNLTQTFTSRNGFGASFNTTATTITTGNNFTVTNSGNGLITFAGNMSLNEATARTITFNSTGDITLTGNLLGSTTAHVFAKGGVGITTLTGIAGTWTGATNLTNGTTVINGFGAFGTANTTAISLGTAGTFGALDYRGAATTGAGETTARAINLAGTTGAGIILANQSGTAPTLLKFSTAFTAAGAGIKVLELGGANTLNNEIAGAIVDNSATNTTAVGKVGPGTWVLSGANTFTGGVTIANGTLKLTGSATNVIADATKITMGTDPLGAMSGFTAGGVFEYDGAAAGSNETVGQLVSAAGAGRINAVGGSSGTTTLTFASLGARTAGATLNLVPSGTGSSIAFTTAPTLTNGIIPGVVFNSTDWAALSGNTAAAYTGYTPATSALAANTAANINIDNTSTGAITMAAAGTTDIYTLRQGDVAARTVDVGTGNILRLGAVGGILAPSASGALTIGTSVAAGGQLTAGGAANSAGELLVYNNAAVVINSQIVPNGTGSVSLTKSGTGALTLNAANTLAGTVTINEGSIVLGAGAAIGSSATNLVIRQNSTFDLGGNAVAINGLTGAGVITNSNATAATLTIGSSNGVGVFSGIIQDGTGQVGVTKAGTGTTMALIGVNGVGSTALGVNTYTGPTTLSGGTLVVNNITNIGTASSIGKGVATSTATNQASLVFSGGVLQYSGNNAQYIQFQQTPSVATDRLFTLAGNGTIDSSGLFGNVGINASSANNAALVFINTNAIAFSGAGARTLTLQGTSTGDNTMVPQLIDNPGGGALAVGKAGAGLWIIGGAANSYTGLTTISAGALQGNDGTNIPAGSPIVLAGGVFQTAGTFTRSLNATPAAGGGGMNFSGTSAGGFSASTGKLTVNIGGAGTPQQLTWASGGFAGGTLILSSTTALFETQVINPIDLNGATRTVQVDDNTTTSVDYATISGVISASGAFGITKTGTGNLVLTGANTYSGTTTIAAGSLTAFTVDGSGGSSNLGTTGALAIGATTTGGTFNYVGAGETTTRQLQIAGTTGGAVIDATGNGALIFTNVATTGAGAKTLTLQGSNTDLNEIRGTLADNGGALTVTKTGSGTWVLSGTNTYTGVTNVSAGALGIGSNSALGTGVLTFGNGTVFAANGDRSLTNAVTVSNATMIAEGFNSLAFAGTLTNTAGNSNVTNLITGPGKTLTFTGAVLLQDAANARTFNFLGTGTTILNGSISNGGTVAGSLNVNMPGGTLILGNTGTASSYTGTTTITQGTLKLNASQQIPDASPLTIAPAAATVATLDLNGRNETVGALTATTAGIGTIDNTAATPATFTFGDANATSITNTTFSIKNSGGGALSLVKTGAGTATFSTGTYTHTGTTASAGGVWNLGGTLNGTTGLLAQTGGTLSVVTPSTLGANSSLVAQNTGTLNIAAPISNPAAVTTVTLESGGTLNLTDNAATQLAPTQLNLAATGAAGGTATLGLELGTQTSSSDHIFATNATTTAGNTVRINIYSLPGFGAASTYDLISSTNGGLGNASYVLGLLPAGSSASLSNTDNLVQLGGVTVGGSPITLYFKGGTGGSNSWTASSGTQSNFFTDQSGSTNAGAVPGSTTTVIFSTSNAPLTGGAISSTLDANFNINDIQFTAVPAGVTTQTLSPGNSAANTLNIAPSSSSVGISVADNAGAVTISAPVNVGADQTWSATGVGTNGSSLSVSGGITGTGSITKAGAGKVTLTGTTGFSGYSGPNLSLNNGFFSIASNGTGSGQFIPFGTANSGNGANLTITAATGVTTTLEVQNSTVGQGSMIGFNNLTFSGSPFVVTGFTTVAGGATGSSGYHAYFNGATSISAPQTITLGISQTQAVPMSLAGQVNASGQTITVNSPVAAGTAVGLQVALRLLNTSSSAPNNIGGIVINNNAIVEGRVAIGGADNGTSSLGGAALTLNSGGVLRLGGQFNGTVTGTSGFTARYYNAAPTTANDLTTFNFFQTPFGTNQTAVVNAPNNATQGFTAGAGMTAPPAGTNFINLTALFSGVLTVNTAGYYGFNSVSDDASILSIDGTTVLSNNGSHGIPGEQPWGTIFLQSGQHVIAQKYAQGTGGGADVLSYQGPDTGNNLVLVGSVSGAPVISPSSTIVAAYPNSISIPAAATPTIDAGMDASIPGLTLNAGSNLTVTGNGISTLTVTGGTVLAGSATVTPNNSANLTLQGVVSESTANSVLTKAGTTTLTLNSANTYTGGTALTAGRITLGNAQALGTGQLTITNSPTLQAGIDLSAGVNNAVLLTGNLTVDGVNNLNLSGTTTVSGGNRTVTNTLPGTANLSFGPVALSLNTTVDTAARVLTLNGAGNTTMNGVISNGAGTAGGAIIKSGTGNVSLAAANTYTGATSIDQGTLALTAAQTMTGALQFGSANTIATTGTLDLSAANGTFGSMTAQTNSAAASIINVPTGRTLTINGNVQIGTAQAAVTSTELDTVGGGSVLVNSSTASVFFNVGGITTAANVGSRTIADFRSLSSLNVSLTGASSVIRVNPQNSNNVNGRASTFYLPNQPASTATLTAASLNIGDSGQNNSVAGVNNQLLLGAGTNTINVATLNIGTGARDGGQILFQGAGGTVAIRDAFTNATTPVRTAVNIGTGGATTATTFDGNILDVSGHTATLLLGTVTMGTQNRTAGAFANTFAWDKGSIDMTSLVAATRTGGAFPTNVDVNLGSANSTAGDNVTIQSGITNFSSNTVAGGTTTANLNINGGTITIKPATTTAITMATASAGTANANLNFNAGTISITGDILRGGGAGTANATLNLAGGSLDMNGKTIGSATSSVIGVFTAGSLANLGQFNGGGTLTKSGSGSLSLTGTNAYTGSTTVNGGTLLNNGTLSASAVIVNSGGKFGGTGSAGSTITVNSGGILAPGNSPGIVTLAGALTLNIGSTYQAEVGGLAGPGTDSSNYDQTVSAATAGSSIAGSNLSMIYLGTPVVSGGGTDPSQAIYLLAMGGSATAGEFASLPEGSTVTFADGLSTAQITYQANWNGAQGNSDLGTLSGGTSGNDVALYNVSLVPEPGTIGLLALAGLGLLSRRRRRNA